MAEHTLSILVKALGASAAAKEISSLSSAAGKTAGGVSKLGGAMGHFKGVIGSLLSPLGIVGLGTGIGGLGLTLDKVIEHTNDFAFSVEKLTNLTGGSAESMSTLLAVFEKFNIDAERTGQIVGFAEKTLGNLSKTSASAGKSAAGLAKAQGEVVKAHERVRVAQLKLIELEKKGKASSSQLAAAQYRVRDALGALAQAQAKLSAAQAGGTTSVSKLMQIDKQYGLHLIDSKGKLVDFGEELRQVADLYTSSLDPAKKAALAAQLFGRGYADLVPILALGRKGIDDASQAAKDLGLTLTAQNATDLKDYRESLREAADAIGGLELQIGLALVPAIKDMANAITSFLKNGGRETIVSFFRNAVSAARSLGETIRTTVIPVFAGIKAGWESIPKEFRDLIVGGLVANKTVKFLFGVSPISFAADSLKGALGSIIGKNIVQPVFVTNQVAGGVPGAASSGGGLLAGIGSIVTKAVGAGLAFLGSQGITAGTSMGGPAGAGVGALGGAGMIAGGALIAGPLGAIAGSIAAVGQTLIDIRQNSAAQGKTIADSVGSQISGGAKLADLQQSLAAVDDGINQIQANPLNVLVAGDALGTLHAQHDALTKQIALMTAGNQQSVAANANQREDRGALHADLGALGGKITDDLGGLKDTMKGIGSEFMSAAHQLAHPKTPAELIHAAAEITKLVSTGHGDATNTQNVLKSLRSQLSKTHDPQLQSTLRADIAKVAGLLPGRQFAATELAEARKLTASHQTTNQKISGLQAIEKDLKDRGLPHAAATIQAEIDRAKAAQVAATNAAAAAIRAKKWQFSVHSTSRISFTNKVVISGREVTAQQAVYAARGYNGPIVS